MAQVPYTGLSDQPTPPGTILPSNYQSISAPASAFGAGIAAADQGLSRADAQTQDAADKMAAMQTQANADGAQNDLGDFARKKLFGDPNDPNQQGYLATQGRVALDTYGDTAKALTDRRDAISATLSPQARLMFDSQSRRYLSSLLDTAGSHAVQQGAVYRKQTADATESNYLQNAAGMAATGNIDGWNQQIGSAQAHAEEYLSSIGADQATIQAKTRDIYSKGIVQRIQQQSVNDPIGAQQLFDQNRSLIDSGVQAPLMEMLKTRGTKAVGDAAGTVAFTAATGGGASPASSGSVADAIHGQESGGKATSATSVDGAQGGWQIIPATFAQYAKPGESISNPADNEAVGRRIVGDLSQRFNGDPARIAVGYFSGPGNVAPAGSPTPWIVDKRDGNGTSVSSYVRGVLGRMGGSATATPDGSGASPGLVYPDDEKAMSVISQIEDPAAQQRAMAKYQALKHQFNAGQSQERATMSSHLNDVQAGLTSGLDLEVPAEADIRRLYPQAQADQIMDKLEETQQFGLLRRSVDLASPDDIATMRQQLADNTGLLPTKLALGAKKTGGALTGDVPTAPEGQPDTTGMALKLKHQAMFEAVVQKRNSDLSADPAGFVISRDTALKPLVDAVHANPSDVDARQQLATATLASQQRLGVPDQDQRVLAVPQAQAQAKALLTADPSTTDAGGQIDALAKNYGTAWPNVWHDLVRDGHMPPDWQVLGSMAPGPGRIQMQRALQAANSKGGVENLRRDIAPADAQSIDRDVDGQLDDFRKSVMIPGLAGNADLFTSVRQAVRTSALYGVLTGQPESDALTNAVKNALPYDFEPQGGLFDKNPSMARAPAGLGGQAQAYGSNMLSNLKPADLYGARTNDPDLLPAQTQEAYTAAVRRTGRWVTNERDDGWTLAVPNAQGGFQIVKRPDGSRLGFKFDDVRAAPPAIAPAVPPLAAAMQ